MVRGEAEWARGVKCFSYRRFTIGVCCVNAVLAVYLLRSLYTSFSVSPSYSTDRSSVSDVQRTQEQIKRVEESIRIRQALEPVELAILVKKLKKELKRGKKSLKEEKQKLAFEVLSRLKGLGAYVNLTEQLEVVQSWRVEKLEEIRRLSVAVSKTKSSIPTKEAKKLKMALEFNWQNLLEGIGFWMPSDIAHTVVDDKPDNAEEIDEEIIPGRPMLPECHAELHTDYTGAAVRWGLTHHTESAADCCQACLDQAKGAKPGELKCNIWVYCPSEFGCYSPDIYEHKHQECWLKQGARNGQVCSVRDDELNVREVECKSDVSLDLNTFYCSLKRLKDNNPRLNFKNEYSESYRNSHPTAPVVVPWMSGVITN